MSSFKKGYRNLSTNGGTAGPRKGDDRGYLGRAVACNKCSVCQKLTHEPKLVAAKTWGPWISTKVLRAVIRIHRASLLPEILHVDAIR